MNEHNHNSNGGDFAEEAETLPRNEHVGSFAEGAKRRCRTNMSARSSRDLAPDLMVIAGFDGYFKRVNPATERILGYSRRELLSRTFQEFVHPDDVERTLDQFAKVMMGGYWRSNSRIAIAAPTAQCVGSNGTRGRCPSDGSSRALAGT
jgi:PAS domain-containing protein